MDVLVWWGITWLALAIVVGVVADARGRSGGAWLALALVLSPLIGLVVVLVMPNLKEAAAQDARRREEQSAHIAQLRAAHAPTVGVADELLRLDELRQRGLLTDAQFDAQRAKLLG